MPIDKNYGAGIAFREVKGGCCSQAAGPNDDDISTLQHDASPWR
jgi:hypothetical protein